MLYSCDFIGGRYSYTRVDVNIVLTADFSSSYIAFVGWVGSMCTLPWVGLDWVEENGPMSKSAIVTCINRH